MQIHGPTPLIDVSSFITVRADIPQAAAKLLIGRRLGDRKRTRPHSPAKQSYAAPYPNTPLNFAKPDESYILRKFRKILRDRSRVRRYNGPGLGRGFGFLMRPGSLMWYLFGRMGP